MSLPPRPEVDGMSICQHGGIDYTEMEELGIIPEEILDFSANLNPFGPPPGVRKALGEVDITHYPDSEATHLRRFLAEKLGVVPGNILVGSGSTELIRLVALAYFGQGDHVLIIEPTFGEYEVACQIVGASLIKQRLSAENTFQLRIEETIELIYQRRPKGVFIANPNNPTGQYISCSEFEKLLDASGDSLVVLDEAYITFADNSWSSIDMIERNNLLILRSMTKDYALAGLRLGYGVARGEIIDILRRIRPPWNVNAIAQQIGIIAMQAEGYLKRCQVELRKAKDYLVAELSCLGLSLIPSEANFFLVEVGNAREFRHNLLERQILVRDCSSFGLPSYVRIAPRTLPECQRLVAAIKEMRGRYQDAS